LVTFGAPGAARADNPLQAGLPFRISSTNLMDTEPSVAYNPKQHLFLVVWQKNGYIHMRTVNERGSLLASERVLNNSFGGFADHPDVAYNSAADQFLVVWNQTVWTPTNNVYIYAARLDGTGQTTLANFYATAMGGSNWPAVAFNINGAWFDFLLVWNEGVEIWAQRVAGVHGAGNTGGGELMGFAFRVAPDAATSATYAQPDVAYNLNRNEYLVVYTRDASGGIGSGQLDIYGRRVTGGGVKLAEHPIDDSPSDQYTPAVAAYRLDTGTPYLVVYSDEFFHAPQPDVGGMFVNGDGLIVGYKFIANSSGIDQKFPDVASSDQLGGYTVVWQRYFSDWDVWGRRISHDGVMQDAFSISVYGDFVIVGFHETEPAVAGGSPVALAAWQGDGWGSGTRDIAGRLLGYETSLPAVLKQ
jgi:hypothetical protein